MGHLGSQPRRPRLRPVLRSRAVDGERLKFDDVRLLSPILPRSKVIGVGRNFADHAAELGNEVPVTPVTFFKPNTSVIGPGDPIRPPAISEHVSYEAELAVIIGRVSKGVKAENALDHVLGYTSANDVTLRDLQKSDTQWTRAKGFDTSCPLGPWIETDLDVDDLSIRSWVNGDLKQDGTTADFIFDIPTIIEHLSETITRRARRRHPHRHARRGRSDRRRRPRRHRHRRSRSALQPRHGRLSRTCSPLHEHYTNHHSLEPITT